jgi:hypothetical protein
MLISALVRIGVTGVLLCFATLALAGGDDWKPVPGHIATRWAKDVSPANCHPEYPRPQMRRREWQSLNGLWDYAVTPIDAPRPDAWDGKILVPFPIESSLSGVGRRVDEKSALTYRRTLRIPESWAGHPVLLHFGAVDWHATVSLNGSVLAEHRGGYDGFTVNLGRLDPGTAYDLVVRVEDATGDGQARGKQWREPNGIWYTPVTGIWQSVWMEPVPAESIVDLKLTPDIDSGRLHIAATIAGTQPATVVEAIALDAGAVVARASAPAGAEIALHIPNPKLWSPDHPFLYDLRVRIARRGKTIDEVESYFGMRKIALGKDASGLTRLMLNNKFLFQVGPLDQGFWPDGIYTAPTDEALRWDIEQMKQLGFNMARKHVKIEPDRWYYWCDKLGLMVWQDMPSSHEIGESQPVSDRVAGWRKQFEHELDRMIEGRRNHPSIVIWVPFNEGWGQYDTERITARVRSLDPSRLIDNPSGWVDKHVGDVIDWHAYPGPGSPKPEQHRAAVLGEFGGLGYGVKGHTWLPAAWGYRQFADIETLTRRYELLLRRAYDMCSRVGLSACIYTQLTDVETECNGLFTYDREVAKMPVERVSNANRGRFASAPVLKTIVPGADAAPAVWRFTTEMPADDWLKPGFDDSAWSEGLSGFGSGETQAGVVGTEWSSGEIWLRRALTLPELDPSQVKLWLHHNSDAEIHVNGVQALAVKGSAMAYDDYAISPEARLALKPGINTMAVHCSRQEGSRFIDVGIVQELPPPADKGPRCGHFLHPQIDAKGTTKNREERQCIRFRLSRLSSGSELRPRCWRSRPLPPVRERLVAGLRSRATSSRAGRRTLIRRIRCLSIRARR